MRWTFLFILTASGLLTVTVIIWIAELFGIVRDGLALYSLWAAVVAIMAAAISYQIYCKRERDYKIFKNIDPSFIASADPLSEITGDRILKNDDHLQSSKGGK